MKKFGAILLFIAVIFSGNLQAQTDTWVGTGPWTTNGNWSLGMPPQGADDVVISGGPYGAESVVTLTSNSTYTGTTSLPYGSDFFTTAAQLLVEGNSGALSGTSSVLVSQYSIFTLGDTGTTVADPDRLNHAASIELAGGQFNLVSSSYAGTTAQQAGELILDQGLSQITLQQANTIAETELDMTDVSAAPGATLLVTGTNLGQAAGTANSSRILFSTAPTLIGGGGVAGTTDRNIVPYIMTSNTGDEGPSGLATYDPVTGLTPLNTATEYASSITTANPTDNVRLTSSASLTTSTTINSLTMVYNLDNQYNLDLGTGNTLNVTSGVLFAAFPGNEGYSAGEGAINNGTINFGSNAGYIYELNVGSAITGTDGLTVNGSTFGGANSYSGVTYVTGAGLEILNNSGLGLTGAGNGTVINNSDLVIGPGVSTSEDITIENANADDGITLSAGSQLNGNVTIDSSYSAISSNGSSTINGDITTSGTGTRTLLVGSVSINGNITDGSGTLALVTGGTTLAGNNSYSGGTTAQEALLVTSATALGTGYLDIESGANGIISLPGDGTIANEITGSGTLTKDGANTVTLTGAFSFTGKTAIAGGILEFGQSTNTMNYSTITGGGALEQNGTGTLTLYGNNNYSGGTIIDAGTLAISSSSNLGTGSVSINGGTLEVTPGNVAESSYVTIGSGTIQVDSGATFSLNGPLYNEGTLTKTGSGILVLNGAASFSGTTVISAGALFIGGVNSLSSGAITDNGVLQFVQTSDSTVGNTISGTGSLTQYGNNTLTLTAANTFSGATLVLTGTLNLSNSLALQDSTIVTGGAGLVFDQSVASHAFTFGGLSGSANLALQDNGGNAVALTLGNNNQAESYSGTLSGSGSLTKVGTATQTLTSASVNSYSGGTTVSAGTLQLTNFATLGNYASALTLNGGTLEIDGVSQTVGDLTGSGGTILTDDSGVQMLTIGYGDATGGNYAGVIENGTSSSGTMALVKVGAGTLTLSGSNTFSGGVTIADGTLQVDSVAAAGSSRTVTLAGASATAPAIFQYDGGTGDLTQSFTVTSGDYGEISNIGGSTLTLGGVINKANSVLIFSNGSFDLLGNLTGGNSATFNSDLVVNSGATVTLDGRGTASYFGPTDIYGGGTLKDGNSKLPAGTVVNLGNASDGAVTNTFDLKGDNQTIAALNSTSNGGTNANIVTNSAASATSTLSLSGVNSDNTSVSSNFGGVIQDGATAKTALAVTGGTHTLSGANTYSGGTTISAGKLYVNNALGSGTGTSSVTVNNGGTLAGSGTIAPSGGSGVTINAGATLASGGVQSGTTAGAGMTLKNTEASSSLLTLNGGSTLSFDLGSTVNNAGSGANNFANPNTNSTYLNITGSTIDQIFSNTTTVDTINLVDLTASSPAVTLTLRFNNPYLLIQTALGNNSDFANLVTNNGVGVNGYVYGVSNGAGGYTAFNIYSLDTSGTPLADPYQGLQLYLNNGDLEVVPEPSTWAMMLGALAVLVFYLGRRKSFPKA